MSQNFTDAVATFYDELQTMGANQEGVFQDLPRWAEVTGLGGADAKEAFARIFIGRQEYRSVVSYRCHRCSKPDFRNRLLSLASGAGWFFVQNLYLSCDDIGPGLYVEHGFSSIVFAKKIGSNFWLNQNVTVGTGKGGNPIIGNDVKIHTGAIVIGAVDIGDNVTIGAGAIVVDDIPSDSTVIPQKSRVISKRKQ